MEQPKARRKFQLDDLSAEDFEFLCFLVAGIEHREVVRIKAPDGGADSGLPTPEREWARCWQAKRFTGHVSWPQCIESLDSAVVNYRMPHYTFCFAKDLTVGQERQFTKHLVGRHPGVVVDYWNRSEIERLLLTTAQGEAIAGVFYEDSRIDSLTLIRALLAGGPIETSADAFARLAAVGDSLTRGDPFYEYVTVTRPVGVSFPSSIITPGAVMAMERIGPETIERIEAVPRGNAVQRPISGTLAFGKDQAPEVSEFFAVGGELTLEGVRLEVRDLPAMFEDPAAGPIETVRLTSPPRPPLEVKFIARTEEDEASIDMTLQPGVPPADWERAYQGTADGLKVLFLVARRESRIEIQLDWSYSDVPEYSRRRAEQLRFVELIRASTVLVMADPAGVRPPFEIPSSPLDVDPELVALRRFVEDVVTIEEWAGVSFPFADKIPRIDMEGIAEAAETVRDGQTTMNFDGISLLLPREQYEELAENPKDVEVSISFGLDVLGAEIMIGVLSGRVPGLVKVDDKTVVQTDPELFPVRLIPATEEARHPVFVLSPLDETETG